MTETPDAAPAPLGPGEVVLAIDVGGTDTKSAIVDADVEGQHDLAGPEGRRRGIRGLGHAVSRRG